MTMARVITITSGKGGVGKTTTTANLGTALAAQNQKVVLIDADIGLRNLDLVLGLENRIVYDIVDVVEGRAKLKQALVRDKRHPDLHLLPAAQTRDKSAVTPEQMKQVCDALRPFFDFIVIDSPAGIEQGFQNAIAGADEVLIVATPEMSAVRDADRIIGLIEASEKDSPRLIINRIRPDMVKRGEMLSVDDVLDVLSIPLVGVVPDDEAIIVATNDGTPIAADEKSLSGKAYRNIALRLMGNDVPFLPLKEKGFLSRIFGFMRS